MINTIPYPEVRNQKVFHDWKQILRRGDTESLVGEAIQQSILCIYKAPWYLNHHRKFSHSTKDRREPCSGDLGLFFPIPKIH